MKKSLLIPLTVIFLTGLVGELYAQPCSCTNCPVPITDNGTFQGLLNVTVDGPNDLSLCPLEQVCFTITHTWVGDLSVTLTSPGGLNYLVMADADNGPGGCGNDQDNIDVCITIGTGNALTNNTQYVCNGPPGTCLSGAWTMPCGGVTDPFSGAQQAPNCNLNDFNLPGQPANGTWILTVNDICAQDVGFLQDWSLVFSCGVLDCFTCAADGGQFNQPNLQGCQGDPAFNLNIVPQYPGSTPPPPAEYSYTFVVSQNGIINSFITGPTLGNLPPGSYQVCGLSYLTDDAGELPLWIGQPFASLQNNLSSGAPAFCGDLSNSCFMATIGPPIPPAVLDTTICLGDCFVAPNGVTCCTPGPCQYTLQSYLGCDSTTIVNITFLPPDQTIVNQTLCPDECLTIGGVDYCPPGFYNLQLVNEQGCDSIVTLNLSAVPVTAVAPTPPPITCSMPAALLNGSFSIGNTYLWTDANNMVVSTQPTAVVNQPGCYLLTVTNTLNGVTCSDTASVCVTADLELPDMPNLQGPAVVCDGDVVAYTITADPLASDYVWTVPADVTIVSGGNGTTAITINWTGSAGGQICVAAANGCGEGPQDCLDVTVGSTPAIPVIAGDNPVCAGDIAFYSTPADPNTDTFTWTVPAGASITVGQGTENITVDWGTATSGDVCVTASNACDPGTPVCFPVTVGQIPVQPAVAGPDMVCEGDIEFYSVAADPNATGYTWTVPGCATILSGDGTNSIELLWSAGCAGGDVCVTADNDCGSSAQTCLTVGAEQTPAAPAIAGPLDVCAGEQENYSTATVPGATDYNWTVTGGLIASGQGTASIAVDWTTPGAGQICLVVTNDCGDSPQTCEDVNVGDIAALPVIAGPTVVCDGSVTQYSVPVDPVATGYTWTTTCGTIVAGQNTNAISIDWNGCPGGGDVCVVLESDCGPSAQVCLPILGGDVPVAPIVNGPDASCLNASETYCVTADPNAASWTWTAVGGTVSSGQGTDCAEVTWTTTGPVQICVVAENGCGQSPQTCFDVTVGDVPPPPTVDGPATPCVGEVATYQITQADPSATSFTWTVNCGQILSGQGTDQIEVQWDVAGANCSVCAAAENVCGLGVDGCFDVEVLAYPTADAGLTADICGLTHTLGALPSLGVGSWTGTGPGNIGFSDPNDPSATVTVDAYGAYQFTWTEDNGGCIDAATVDVSFNPDPVLAGGIAEDCTPDGQTYAVSFTLTGGVSPYTVTGTITGTMNGDQFTSDLIASGTPYSFQVTDALGCGPLLVEGSETCDCVTDAGTMDLNPIELCEDATATAVAPADATFDPNDIFEFILHTDNGTNGSTLGTIIDQNTSGAFDFLPGQMNYGELYFISYAVGNDAGNGTVDLTDDCTDLAQGTPVTFFEIPVPDAGPDDAICGLSYTLAAVAPLSFGQWTQVSGPGMAIFTDPTFEGTEVTVDQFGAYTFAWTEDNNDCTGSDDVSITFNDGPALSGGVGESCDLISFTFTVTFDITNGAPPYTVTGTATGTLTGNTFTSDPIPNLTDYSFEVTDANGCGPLVVSGFVECVCATDAGLMDLIPQEICEDELVTVPATTGAVLDPEDILLYVLHSGSGSSLGAEVFGYSDTPTFGLIPPMQTGVTYYISAIAGNDFDLDGVIDANDPCVSVAPGTPVVFTALPIASFAGDVTVCEGDLAELTVVVNSATCVDISYDLGGSVTTVPCLSNGDVISIPTSDQSLIVTMTTVTDQAGCTNNSGSVANIVVNLIPEATVSGSASICNSTDSGNPTVLDFSTLVTGGDQGGVWENTDGASVSGAFPNLDFTGATPGIYTFTYTTASALPPCQDQSYTAEVTVEDCECPDLGFAPAPTLCNDGDLLDLGDLQVETLPGTYTISGTPAGAVNLPQINGSQFNASGADPGVYEITFDLGTVPPQGCPLSNTLTVAVSAELSAGAPAAAPEVCFGESAVTDLNGLLTGADPGGSWTEVSATPSTGGAFNAAAGTFNTNSQAAGTYTFRYTVTPAAPCSPASAEVSVVVHPLPVADAGADATLTCFEPALGLGGNGTSQGAQFTYEWTSAAGAFPGTPDVPFPDIAEPGSYTLTVTNLQTGCTATDEVVIDADQEIPTPYFTVVPVGCFGDSDGAILVDSVTGGKPPYLYSLNGAPFVSGGFFTNLPADSYTLVVEDANGCQTEVFTIDIQQPQELSVELVAYVDDNTIRLGEAAELEALVNVPVEDIDTIVWSPPGLVDCDSCLVTTAMPLQTTTFSVMIESNGCAESDDLRLTVRRGDVYVANVFSPNGDGENDVFFIQASASVARIKTFRVFNRWGEPVYEAFDFQPNDPAFGWNGMHRGEPVNPSVFAWFAEIEFLDGVVELLEGDVTVVR